MADINAIAEQIQGLTLLEASQLVKLLEEKLGVSAAAASVAVAAPARVARRQRLPGRREDRVYGRPDRRWAPIRSMSSRQFAKSPASA